MATCYLLYILILALKVQRLFISIDANLVIKRLAE